MHQRLFFVPVLTLLALALTTATVDAAKITLEKEPVFTDAPSIAGAASLKVNDLDLTLYRPSFIPANWRSYCGNHFEQGSWYSEDIAGKILPAAPTDTHNTVEVIRVPAGALNGPFSVRVTARTVQANAVPGFDGEAPNQDFALYVYNAVQ
jgi:hypothetical protein